MSWDLDTGTRSGMLFACKIAVFEAQEARFRIVCFQGPLPLAWKSVRMLLTGGYQAPQVVCNHGTPRLPPLYGALSAICAQPPRT